MKWTLIAESTLWIVAILTSPGEAFETLTIHPTADRNAIEVSDVLRLLTELTHVLNVVTQIRAHEREATGTLGVLLQGALLLP